MINTQRYIELSDAVLRKLATIQAKSIEQWFEQAEEITDIVAIHDFATLWQELRDYGREIQYIQLREADSDLYDFYESRLEHIIILGQRLVQLGQQFGVKVK